MVESLFGSPPGDRVARPRRSGLVGSELFEHAWRQDSQHRSSCLPRQGQWYVRSVTEYTASSNEVIRRMKLEEKQLASSQRLEVSTSARLPKIDFVERCHGAQRIKPSLISYPDKYSDHDRSYHNRACHAGAAGSSGCSVQRSTVHGTFQNTSLRLPTAISRRRAFADCAKRSNSLTDSPPRRQFREAGHCQHSPQRTALAQDNS